MKFIVLVCGIILLLLAVGCSAQVLPSKILGYKVQTAKAVVTTDRLDPAAEADILIRLGEMSVSHIGMLGATLNVSGEMLSKAASGKVDRLMFRDLRINGVAVDVDDVTDDFNFEKDKSYTLEKSLRAHLSPINAVKAGFSAITDGREKWAIAGTLFVFCRVKKFGFTFKRVIPIKLSLNVKNPLL